MGFFIGSNGKIYKEGTQHEPFDLERIGLENWFSTRFTAYTVKDIIEEYYPMTFIKD